MIPLLFRLLIAMLALCALPVAASVPVDRYAAGQVWEYRTRPQDVGSLLKIQQVEDGGTIGTVYHLSVIGITLRSQSAVGILQHTPVSRATLDASVIRLSDVKRTWPDATAGIAQWREAQGGVFTIPVAQIIDLIDKTVPDPQKAGPSTATDAT